MFNDKRLSCIEASTKAGKTHGCIVWLWEQALFCEPGQHVWWVAPVFGQAKIAYERMKRSINPAFYHKNDSEMTLRLFNGAIIAFKSADRPDSLYGEDVYAAVVDEASRVKEDAWHAVRSTLTATQGPIRCIGNVKGRKNWFFLLCRKIEAGQIPNSFYAKLTAYDAVEGGIFPLEEIESARAMMPEHVFRELYLAEPSDDGGNPFDLRAIEACVAPLAIGTQPVAWGWDLAKSHDWTAGVGLNENGQTCRFERFQKPWRDTKRTIRKHTIDVPAMVDSTGVGDPVLEDLQALEPGMESKNSNFQGFKFSSSSKQQLMEGLAAAISQQAITFPDGPIRLELEQFEYEYTATGIRYSAPSGFHDDAVCALALAVRQWKQPKKFFMAMALG